MDIEMEVELDDALVASLVEYTGITDISELVRTALNELIDRERRRRSGGSLDEGA